VKGGAHGNVRASHIFGVASGISDKRVARADHRARSALRRKEQTIIPNLKARSGVRRHSARSIFALTINEGVLKMTTTIETVDSDRSSRIYAKASAEKITYGIGQSSLGVVLVARAGAGVCAVSIGSASAELKSELAEQFPSATLVHDDAGLAKDVEKVVNFTEDPANEPDFVLDVRGTEFQKRVRNILLSVPAGKTITYAALAARVGEPKAIRAVANACAANAIALAIPCHRVIRKDGALSGYRWGIETKRALLAREAMV
jgi:O-6-methylguanine DNA methyltransferase